MRLAVISGGRLGESGIFGSVIPVAVGAGLSARLGDGLGMPLLLGDRAAGCGSFQESFICRRSWELPVVLLCS